MTRDIPIHRSLFRLDIFNLTDYFYNDLHGCKCENLTPKGPIHLASFDIISIYMRRDSTKDHNANQATHNIKLSLFFISNSVRSALEPV